MFHVLEGEVTGVGPLDPLLLKAIGLKRRDQEKHLYPELVSELKTVLEFVVDHIVSSKDFVFIVIILLM
jgi:hypothetical protein